MRSSCPGGRSPRAAPPAAPSTSVAYLREHFGGGLAIDLTRKQVAGNRVTWTARADADAMPGAVRAEFRDGRITSLELGGREP
jgi:hypothetical protein